MEPPKQQQNQWPGDGVDELLFVVNAVPALIAYVDANARYVWGNDSYRRWFGYPPEHIRGLHVGEVLGTTAWAQLQPYVERVLSGEQVTFDHRLVYKNGPPRDVRAAYIPHLDVDGQVRGFVGMVHDVTELRAAEAALRRSEHMLERSQSAAHVGSWEMPLVDGRAATHSLQWSAETYRIYGYAPGALDDVGSAFQASVHPEDRETMSAAWILGARRSEPFENEYRIVRPDGSVRMIHGWTYVENDDDGRPARMLGTCEDVTERRRVEHELREADRRKDEFLAMLSHELRNPLAPILNAVEVLDRAAPDDRELASKYRPVIARQVQHMKRLLDDLLDLSRVRQGKIQLQKRAVELGALLLQAVEASRPLIAEKRQQLSLALALDLLPIEADPTRVVQVFTNLLNNAAKYTDPGGHIALTVTAENGEAVVSVRDDGTGMSPDRLTHVFDLFVQETRSRDRAQGGLGIGLTMVRTLVQMHGGSVRAFSEGSGRGSEFVVRLPLAGPANVPLTREAPAPSEVGVEHALRVLVVDDNVDAADAIGDVFEMLGHEVSVAHDGPGALAAAADLKPDLILLDIGLPGMDGYAVAERLRAAGHERAALVALTGFAQEQDLRQSSRAGFDRHMIKPVSTAVLRKLAAEIADRTKR